MIEQMSQDESNINEITIITLGCREESRSKTMTSNEFSSEVWRRHKCHFDRLWESVCLRLFLTRRETVSLRVTINERNQTAITHFVCSLRRELGCRDEEDIRGHSKTMNVTTITIDRLPHMMTQELCAQKNTLHEFSHNFCHSDKTNNCVVLRLEK